MKDRYYISEIGEFHVGFKFQSTHILFSEDGKWEDCEINKENIKWFKDIYLHDAYKTEFRAIENNIKNEII